MDYETLEDGKAGLPAAAVEAEGGSPSFLQRLRNAIPETVNLEILDPSSSHPPNERFYLLNEYRQPWSSFFNINEFNLPIFSEYKTRFHYNVGAFFYNYFIIACVYLLVYAIFNFWSVLALVGFCAVAYFLLVKFPDDIEIGSLTITRNIKLAIVIIVGILSVTIGGLYSLLLSVVFFLVAVVGVHASIREHAT